MRWFTSKPYWLRGGITGEVIAILLSLLYFLCLGIIKDVAGIICLFIVWPGSLTIFLFDDFLFQLGEPVYLAAFALPNFILLFIIGAILGWIYGKLKSKYKHA